VAAGNPARVVKTFEAADDWVRGLTDGISVDPMISAGYDAS
jgi:hypothetical protein